MLLVPALVLTPVTSKAIRQLLEGSGMAVSHRIQRRTM
jgi:hypothetical protein